MLDAPAATRRARETRDDGALTIKGLLSYRLHVVANLLSRGAALRYKREFGVSLWEWRTVALLGAQAPLSLNELAAAAGLDKSQMSRVVAGLVGRGIVARGADETDGRGVRLSLTRSGEKLYEGLIRAATHRNDAFLGCLAPQERDCLEGALQKLGDQARALIQQEKALGQRKRRVHR
jgi:DNA-binding MarR family transcriptional regulator